MKRFLFPLLLIATALNAADISTTQSFTDGDTVTGAKLNNIVGNSSILPGSISDRTAASPITSDYFNFYQVSSGTIKKSLFSSLTSLFLASPTFTGTLTSSQQTALSGIITPSQITSDQNDYNPTSLATSTTLRLSTDASRNITGITAQPTGTILIIHNVGSFNIVLNNQNAGSSAANRFVFANALDDVILPDGARWLQYDGTTARWRAVGRTYSVSPAFVTLTDGTTITWTLDPTKVSQNATVTLGATQRQLVMSGLANGMTGVLKVVQDGTGSRKLALHGPSFTDGVGVGSTTFTSATATFVAGDVGRVISEPGNTHIPAGTTISSRTNSTTVVLSASVTSGTGITFYLPGRTSLVSGGGAGAASLTTTASATDILTWITDGTSVYWTKSLNFN